MRLVAGETCARRDIHNAYKGQEQSGISTPAQAKEIFLFSSPTSGRLFGYEDGWEEDGTFRFAGEGQVGDMLLNQGNWEIFDHRNNLKRLHLFVSVDGGKVRYEGEMRYIRHEWKRGPDKNGIDRQVLLFYLSRVKESPGLELVTP